MKKYNLWNIAAKSFAWKGEHKVLWQVDFFFIFRILDVLSNTKKTFRIAATVLSHLILGYHLFSDAYQNLIYSDE